MPQNQEAFFIYWEYIDTCNNPMLTVCGCFHEVSHTSFASVVDIATLRLRYACCNLFGDWSDWRLLETWL